MLLPDRRRVWVVILGAIGGLIGYLIHEIPLYYVWGNIGIIDKVAHLCSGIGVAAIVALMVDHLDIDQRLAIVAIMVIQVALAIVWEITEGISPVEYQLVLFDVKMLEITIGYDYFSRWPDPLYITDTIADMAITLLGSVPVIGLLIRIPDEPL